MKSRAKKALFCCNRSAGQKLLNNKMMFTLGPLLEAHNHQAGKRRKKGPCSSNMQKIPQNPLFFGVCGGSGDFLFFKK